MKTVCRIIDLSGNLPIQDVEKIDKSTMNESRDANLYVILMLFPCESAWDKVFIMCGGCGLLNIKMQHEGYEFAPWFNLQNVSFAILKYHLPADDRFATINDASLAVQSMRLLYPDINLVGVMGASIGGYIAAHAAIF